MPTAPELIERIGQLEKRLADIRAAAAIFEEPSHVPEGLRAEEFMVEQEIMKLNDALASPAEINAPAGPVRNSATAFIIMPFKEPFTTYYRDVIKPAVIDVNYEILRSDEIYSPTAFLQTIWEQVIKSFVIISEMTGMNPNVLYELGLCHAIAKKVIMITQNIDDIPSDLRHINCIVYNTADVNWADKLRNSIQRMILFRPSQEEDHIVLRPKATIDNTVFFDKLSKERDFFSEKSTKLERQNIQYTRYIDDLKRRLASIDLTLSDSIGSPKKLLETVERLEDGLVIYTQKLPDTKCTIDLVRVDAGDFIFGNVGNAQEVELSEYYISRYSITNVQYCSFLDQMGNAEEGGSTWINLEGKSPCDRCRIKWRNGRFFVEEGFEDYPVTYVNFYGASAFCTWGGGKLPSVEQWEKAVRGTDGREYPWGNQPPNPELANIDETGWARDVPPIDVREKSRGCSPFGVIQGIGNVWHWTETYYPDRDVQAVRGGSFFDFRLGNRSVYRFLVHPNGPDFSQGFLMVKRFLNMQRQKEEENG